MKKSLFFLILLAFTTSASWAQESWSLNRCIEHARTHSIDIQRGQNALANAKLTEMQSKLAFLPTANINGGYYWNFGLTIDQSPTRVSLVQDKPLVPPLLGTGHCYLEVEICTSFNKRE